MNDYLEVEEYGNVRVTLYHDPDPMPPTEWDNLTTIRGWHRRYNIGDGPNIDTDSYDGWDDMIASIRVEYNAVFMAPLYWYEHSGVTCKMGPSLNLAADDQDVALASFRSACLDDAGWDSGVAGLVIVSAKSQASMGTPDKLLEEAARGEVETYASYLEGRVYGYVVSILTTCDHGDEHADTLDSCWGFIGEPEYAMSEGRAFVSSSVIAALA